MPGPPLASEFVYNGTPSPLYRSDKYTTLSREMIQTQRFYNSKDTGTHKRNPQKVNIPRNSQAGVGASSGGISVENVDL